MTLVRSLAGSAAALAALLVLGLGGVASATPQQTVDVDLCAQVQAEIDSGGTTVADLPEQVAVDLNAALDASADLDPAAPLSVALDGLGCTDATPTPDPAPTTTTPAPSTSTEPPFVDRDCADLAPGEAERLLRENPADPNRLDANRNGVPCELDDIARENDTSSVIPTPGSGASAQFDAMPSTAPQTGGE